MNSVIFLVGFPFCIKNQIILHVVTPIWMVLQHKVTLKYSNKKSNPNIQHQKQHSSRKPDFKKKITRNTNVNTSHKLMH